MKKAAIALAVAAATAISVLNISATARAETDYGNDYSRTGYGFVSIGAADFIESMPGITLFEEERQFLTAHSSFALKYSDGIAGKSVKLEYKSDTGELTVTPSAFSYNAVNGKTVTWEPVAVNGKDISGIWGAVIDDSYVEDTVTVTYHTSFTIPYSQINDILNLYYNEAEKAYTTIENEDASYQTWLEEYLTAQQAYSEYVEYLEWYEEQSALYNDYLQRKYDWDIKNRLYQNYLEACEQYELDKLAYAKYEEELKEFAQQQARFRQYLIDKAEYDDKYEEYQAKINDPRIAKELSHLEILEYLYEPVIINGNNPRTLYNAIMGDSVTTVLSRLGEVDDSTLSLAQLKREPIDDAEIATKNLRDILSKLNACKTDEDKYLLYIAAYDSLKENLEILLQALDYCFNNSFVRSQLRDYQGVNRELQFEVMLAQLYTVCHALDNRDKIGSYYWERMPLYEQNDKGNASKYYYFDSTYRIDGKTPAQLLGSVILEDTNDAQPIDGYVPIPEEPVAPAEVAEPQQPDRVNPPVEPEEVPGPGDEPTPEQDPGPKREEVLEPVVDRFPYEPTEEEQALYNAFAAGTLSKRQELTNNYVFEAYCEVDHYFRNAQTITVSFYLTANSPTPVYEVADVQAGSSVEYEGPTPTPNSERGYTLVFDGWQDAEGNRIDINKVPSTSGENLKLYPHFSKTPNMYEVVWIIDSKLGLEVRTQAAYGTKPAFDGIPEKPIDEDGYRYRFLHWDRDMEEMTDQTVYYTAVFEKSCFITFKLYSQTYVISYWKGEMPECPESNPQRPSTSQNYYIFAGWKNGSGNIVPISQVAGDETYTAQFEARAILSLGGNDKATIALQNGMYVATCITVQLNPVLDITYLAGLAVSEGAGIILNMPTCTISFSAEEVYLLNQSGALTIKPSQPLLLNSTTSGYESYRFFVDISGRDGQTYDRSFTYVANNYCILDEVYSKLFRLDGDAKIEIDYAYSQNAVTFSMRAGYYYEIYPQYSVYVLSENDGAEPSVKSNVTTAVEKDTIILTVTPPQNGQFVQMVYYLDASGAQVELFEDEDAEEPYTYTFHMPEGEIWVGVIYGYYEYTITFISEGEVIATRICRWGDTVAPPTPAIAPDGVYSYTFVGWDKDVVTVTGDAVYVAQFTKELLPTPDPPALSQKMQILLWLVNHIVMLMVIAAVVLALIIAGIILGVVRHKKKRKAAKLAQFDKKE